MKTPDLTDRVLTVLSPRERLVASLIAEGMSNREVAGSLGLSENTIRQYLVRIFRKVGVATRVELALYWLGLAADTERRHELTEVE